MGRWGGEWNACTALVRRMSRLPPLAHVTLRSAKGWCTSAVAHKVTSLVISPSCVGKLPLSSWTMRLLREGIRSEEECWGRNR